MSSQFRFNALGIYPVLRHLLLILLFFMGISFLFTPFGFTPTFSATQLGLQQGLRVCVCNILPVNLEHYCSIRLETLSV
jgi:hypothetical protein